METPYIKGDGEDWETEITLKGRVWKGRKRKERAAKNGEEGEKNGRKFYQMLAEEVVQLNLAIN